MTATQPDSEGYTRRGVMRATAVGIGSTAAAGLGTKFAGSPVGDAAAIDGTTLKLAASTVIGGPVAIAALAYGEIMGGPDDSEVADALDWQTHVAEYTRAREDNLMLEQTLASLQRDVQLVENKAREEAIFRVYEQGVDSGTEADATAAAEEAINDAYATVERAILQSWNVRFARTKSVLHGQFGVPDSDNEASILDEPGLTTILDGVESTNTGNGTHNWGADAYVDYVIDNHVLLDGTAIDVEQYLGNDTGETAGTPLPDNVPSGIVADGAAIVKPNPGNYGTVDSSDALDESLPELVPLIEGPPWISLMEDLYAAHTPVLDEVSSMVDTYFQPAQDGEIDLHEALGPAHLSDTASNASDYQEAAMAMRSMGYPLAEEATEIEIEDGDGEVHELLGRLSWTAHSGNTLEVGTELNPENIPGSIFAAINVPDGFETDETNTTNTSDGGGDADGPGGTIIEINDPFTIVSAEGASEVSFEDRTLASADNITHEEINQIFKENFEANREAEENVHDTATYDDGSGGGAGGGFFDGNSPDIGVIAAVLGGLGVVYALFVDDGGGN